MVFATNPLELYHRWLSDGFKFHMIFEFYHYISDSFWFQNYVVVDFWYFVRILLFFFPNLSLNKVSAEVWVNVIRMFPFAQEIYDLGFVHGVFYQVSISTADTTILHCFYDYRYTVLKPDNVKQLIHSLYFSISIFIVNSTDDLMLTVLFWNLPPNMVHSY